MSVRELRDPSSLGSPEFPFLMSTALMLIFDDSLMGILAIGEPLTHEEMSGDELDLLRAMTSNFMVHVQNARDVETIYGLNRELYQSNEQLRVTIADLTAARDKIEILEAAKDKIKSLIAMETERAGRFTLFDFVLVLSVAFVIGVLFNFSNPNRISLLPTELLKTPPPEISFVKTQEMLVDPGLILIDARPPEFFDQKRVPGAINLPPALFDFVYSMRLSGLDITEPLFIYGRTLSKRYDLEVASALRIRGHTNVMILEGSFDQWEKRGFPVEPAS
jgi:rhodanese-related sulfurtransferase